LAGHIAFCFDGGGAGSWFDHAEQCLFDRVIDPQSAESNAPGLAIFEQTTPAGIARNIMIVSGVPNRQLSIAPFATEKAGKQSVSMLRRSMIATGRYIVADHLADLLRPFPTVVTFVRIRDQGKPFITRLAANSRSAIISRHGATLTISVGSAVDRIHNHPVNGSIIWPAPDDLAIGVPDRQVQPLFEEP
jgi:hypothetical protein